MEFIDAEEYEIDKDPMPELYREFTDREGIPVHEGVFIKNVNDLETDYWELTGQEGAFVNLYGTEGVNDLQVHRIEPGGETELVHTYYDEIVYATEGNGLTVIGDGDDPVSFEWNDESLFYLPHNVPYKYVNLSDEPARLISTTPLPQYLLLRQDIDYYMDPPIESEAFRYDEEFFLDEGRENLEGGDMFKKKSLEEGFEPPMVWETNFIPRVSDFDKIQSWNKLGAMAASFVSFPPTSAFAHISQIDSGHYKKAHRHNPGAHLFIRSGEGYSLMWGDNEDVVLKTDWGENSVFVPPARWWHHHFNCSEGEVRQVVTHPVRLGTMTYKSVFDTWREDNRIEYVDEDPAVRQLYEEELEKRGLEFQMPEECYTDPDFSF